MAVESRRLISSCNENHRVRALIIACGLGASVSSRLGRFFGRFFEFPGNRVEADIDMGAEFGLLRRYLHVGLIRD